MHFIQNKGRKNLVFVNRGDTPSNRFKIQGFCEALQKTDAAAQPSVLWLDGDDEWQSAYDAVVCLMKDHPKTDGIICTTDFIANAAVRALLDLGIHIPEQVSVIGVDNSVYAKISYPKLTSLDNKMQILSITCSDILLKVLNGEQVPNKMIIFSNIVERETT